MTKATSMIAAAAFIVVLGNVSQTEANRGRNRPPRGQREPRQPEPQPAPPRQPAPVPTPPGARVEPAPPLRAYSPDELVVYHADENGCRTKAGFEFFLIGGGGVGVRARGESRMLAQMVCDHRLYSVTPKGQNGRPAFVWCKPASQMPPLAPRAHVL